MADSLKFHGNAHGGVQISDPTGDEESGL